MRDWVPELARAKGAGRPFRVPAWLVKRMGMPLAVHWALTMPGASNARVRSLGWAPKRPSVRQGFQDQ
jgi:hypothetical protein